MKERIIPFLKYRYVAYGFSISLFIIFVVITVMKGGLHLGVDFVGGLKVIAKFEKNVDESRIRHVLRDYSPTVQQIGEADDKNFIISTKLRDDSAFVIKDRIIELLEQKYPGVELPKEDVIIVSFKGAVDEGALKQKLAGFDALTQRTGLQGKNDFVIYKKEIKDKKKSSYNPDLIESALKNGYKDIELLNGICIEALFDKPVEEARINELVKKFSVGVSRTDHTVKQGYLIYKVTIDDAEKIKNDLLKEFKKVEILSVENVGPAVGKYLRMSAVKLILMSISLMTIYLAYRFELRYAVGAMVALVHDIMLATAFCGVAGVEINIPVVAALLTIYGYSVHDTIVIFDRIREKTQIETKMSFIDVMDRAITQTLSRTTLTVLLTLFSVTALWLLGGEGITDFALVLIFGFLIGCYSSIYQASPVVLWWEKFMHKVRS